jgi:hypothetical protein
MSRVLPAAIGLVTLLCSSGVVDAQNGAINTLTAQEKAAGWKLLFDGKHVTGWRGFRTTTAPAGWKAIDGLLVRESGGGDLMTVDQYGDFELSLDWKVPPGGNSGIIYRISGEGDEVWHSGPEMQILDNKLHKDGANPLTSAGANYAVNPPVRDVSKPAGEWNSARLVVKGAHVEHWLNGVKVVEYELWTPDWEKRVQASKFAKIAPYGKAKRGHIAIQDHGDVVSFRNIKIRPL